MGKNVIEPKHSVHYSKEQSHVSNSLASKAKEKAKESLKENPAFGWVKMQAKKSPVIAKSPKNQQKGTARNLPTTGDDELVAMGKA